MCVVFNFSLCGTIFQMLHEACLIKPVHQGVNNKWEISAESTQAFPAYALSLPFDQSAQNICP